jgi:hypothetical protein
VHEAPTIHVAVPAEQAEIIRQHISRSRPAITTETAVQIAVVSMALDILMERANEVAA